MVTRVRRVVLGVDLGKRQTPATIIAAQTKSTAEPVWDPVHLRWNQGPGLTAVAGKGRGGLMASKYSPHQVRFAGEYLVVRWVESVPLGTSYDHVARRIWEIAEESEASEVWMDGTGVGIAVEEMVRHRKPPGLKCLLRAVTITSGQAVSQTSVPRRELMTRLAVEWQEGRVKLATGLSGWPELRTELLGLDGQGRKQKARDDLALGLALAVWGLTGTGATAGRCFIV